MQENDNKKSILIIVDKEGWAFYNSALQIKKNLFQYYNIEIIPMDLFGDNIIKLFIFANKYDLTFFMWRGLITWLYSDYSKAYINKIGMKYEEFLEKYVKEKRILTGIFDHLYINSEQERTNFVLENVTSYIVCSKKLQEIYEKYLKKPEMTISDGVDLDVFKMTNMNKYNDIENRKIIFGWAGNSKFIDENDDDLKGLNKIITPAICELKEEGYKIELNIADRNIKKIEHKDMPNYYNSIDVYICASRTEGHPAPVLEAMACGLPVISTDVGVVQEVFGEKQKEYIIKREKEDLKLKIKNLIDNKSLIQELSNENLESIKKWSWEEKAKLYRILFEENLKK